VKLGTQAFFLIPIQMTTERADSYLCSTNSQLLWHNQELGTDNLCYTTPTLQRKPSFASSNEQFTLHYTYAPAQTFPWPPAMSRAGLIKRERQNKTRRSRRMTLQGRVLRHTTISINMHPECA